MGNGVHDLRSFSARRARADGHLDTVGQPSLKTVADQIQQVARALRDPVTGPHRCAALAADLFRVCDQLASLDGAGAEPLPAEVRRAYATLSPRELEIFAALAQGLSVGDIAEQLSRSPKTVNNHRTHIMKKLGLRNTAQLTRLAFRLGVASL
jgi:DNA-binding NarL/FixJ family response regulator